MLKKKERRNKMKNKIRRKNMKRRDIGWPQKHNRREIKRKKKNKRLLRAR
jgi:hypothetical protein